jgi:hypothetical protein
VLERRGGVAFERIAYIAFKYHGMEGVSRGNWVNFHRVWKERIGTLGAMGTNEDVQIVKSLIPYRHYHSRS